MVRELHGESLVARSTFAELQIAHTPSCSATVYGTAVPVHARDPTRFQHQGIGTLLMEEAERIAREEHGSRKLAVISGIGVRSYCNSSFPSPLAGCLLASSRPIADPHLLADARLGFKLDGPYMS